MTSSWPDTYLLSRTPATVVYAYCNWEGAGNMIWLVCFDENRGRALVEVENFNRIGGPQIVRLSPLNQFAVVIYYV
jgi:hypothetical protein